MIQIQTTSNLKKVLKNIATELLKQKLAVCTHITKISCSSYIWKDEVVSKKEYKLEIKTIKKYTQKNAPLNDRHKKGSFKKMQRCFGSGSGSRSRSNPLKLAIRSTVRSHSTPS